MAIFCYSMPEVLDGKTAKSLPDAKFDAIVTDANFRAKKLKPGVSNNPIVSSIKVFSDCWYIVFEAEMLQFIEVIQYNNMLLGKIFSK